MKYSLKNRQTAEYLKKADEILIAYKDRKALPTYAEKYPEAALTLEVPPATQWEIAEIKEYSILARGRLTLCIPEITLPIIAELAENNIPYFWGYTVTTATELASLEALGVSQVRIGAPLFFQTDILKRFNVKYRIAANIAHEGYLPIMSGINGSWIRPEDVELYEGIFDIIEFADCDNNKEQALFRIYAEDHAWPGQVEMLITNIEKTGAYNRMLPREFTEARLNCGQKCAAKGKCQICYRYFNLAQRDRIKEYAEEMNLI